MQILQFTWKLKCVIHGKIITWSPLGVTQPLNWLSYTKYCEFSRPNVRLLVRVEARANASGDCERDPKLLLVLYPIQQPVGEVPQPEEKNFRKPTDKEESFIYSPWKIE